MTALVLGAAVLLLAWIAFDDIRRMRIANWSVGALCLLFVVFALAAGAPRMIADHAILGAVVFAGLMIPYHFGWMGGGDVKMLAVAFLWTGLHCAFLFALLLLVASLVHTALAWTRLVPATAGEDGRRKIPFGPAIAAALALTLALCLRRLVA